MPLSFRHGFKEVGMVNFQVALLLLCQCGGFCQMVPFFRTQEGLHLIDEECVRLFQIACALIHLI